jgi:predicted phosphoribosyltransferase
MAPNRFTDREQAGVQLGERLREQGVDADIVLAIPRGGLPLGRAVADALDAPLDIAVASKIGAPHNPEYAIGAVASDGSLWRNEEAFEHSAIDERYFEQQREQEQENAREKARRYRGDQPEPELTGKTVVLVDDGVATGSTIRACLEQIRSREPASIILALPVGPSDTIAELAATVDEMVCLEVPSRFRAVGQAYDRFDQVSDERAMSYLDRGS